MPWYYPSPGRLPFTLPFFPHTSSLEMTNQIVMSNWGIISPWDGCWCLRWQYIRTPKHKQLLISYWTGNEAYYSNNEEVQLTWDKIWHDSGSHREGDTGEGGCCPLGPVKGATAMSLVTVWALDRLWGWINSTVCVKGKEGKDAKTKQAAQEKSLCWKVQVTTCLFTHHKKQPIFHGHLVTDCSMPWACS